MLRRAITSSPRFSKPFGRHQKSPVCIFPLRTAPACRTAPQKQSPGPPTFACSRLCISDLCSFGIALQSRASTGTLSSSLSCSVCICSLRSCAMMSRWFAVALLNGFKITKGEISAHLPLRLSGLCIAECTISTNQRALPCALSRSMLSCILQTISKWQVLSGAPGLSLCGASAVAFNCQSRAVGFPMPALILGSWTKPISSSLSFATTSSKPFPFALHQLSVVSAFQVVSCPCVWARSQADDWPIDLTCVFLPPWKTSPTNSPGNMSKLEAALAKRYSLDIATVCSCITNPIHEYSTIKITLGGDDTLHASGIGSQHSDRHDATDV
jgi:hypothetical protein